MAPDQTPWRDGIETKEAEKQRGKLYQCSVRPSDQKISRRKVEGQFQVSRLINQWYRGSYTVAFLAGNHWKQIWDSVLFRSKDQEVLIRQECMFLHQPKTRRFQLEN